VFAADFDFGPNAIIQHKETRARRSFYAKRPRAQRAGCRLAASDRSGNGAGIVLILHCGLGHRDFVNVIFLLSCCRLTRIVRNSRAARPRPESIVVKSQYFESSSPQKFFPTAKSYESRIFLPVNSLTRPSLEGHLPLSLRVLE
jgi:hypothetical protein